MGEDEKPRNTAHDNDGNRAEAESINTQAAEEKTAAFSFSESVLSSVRISDESVKRAANAFVGYTAAQLSNHINIREAYLSTDRKAFDEAVGTVLDTAITDIVSGSEDIECDKVDFLSFYGEIFDNPDFKTSLYNAIGDGIYSEQMVAETSSYDIAQDFVEQSALHSYVELNKFKHDLNTPERADYRAQVKAVYDYENSHGVEQADRITGMFEEENVPVARLDKGVTEKMIRDKYDEIITQNKELDTQTQATDSNIIGNTEYKYIAKKNYRKLDTAVAKTIAAELEEKGVKFSGRIRDDSTTLTVGAADVETLDKLIYEHSDKSISVNVQFTADNWYLANQSGEPLKYFDRAKTPLSDVRLDFTINDEFQKEGEFKEFIDLIAQSNKSESVYLNSHKDELITKIKAAHVTLGLIAEKTEAQQLDTPFDEAAFEKAVDEAVIEDVQREMDNERANTKITQYELYKDGEKVGSTPFLSEAKEFADENYTNSYEETSVFIGPVTPDYATYEIYQLKEGEQYHGIRFSGMDTLKRDGVSLNTEDYNLVYSGTLADITEEDKLEGIYQRLNVGVKPEGYTGHSLSVSDVVVINNGSEKTAHFVDSIGYTNFPEFLREKTQDRAEKENIILSRDNMKNVVKSFVAWDEVEDISDFAYSDFGNSAEKIKKYVEKSNSIYDSDTEIKTTSDDKGITFIAVQNNEETEKATYSWNDVVDFYKQLIIDDQERIYDPKYLPELLKDGALNEAIRNGDDIKLSSPTEEDSIVSNAFRSSFSNLRVSFDEESKNFILIGDDENGEKGLWLNSITTPNENLSVNEIKKRITDYISHNNMTITGYGTDSLQHVELSVNELATCLTEQRLKDKEITRAYDEKDKQKADYRIYCNNNYDILALCENRNEADIGGYSFNQYKKALSEFISNPMLRKAINEQVSANVENELSNRKDLTETTIPVTDIEDRRRNFVITDDNIGEGGQKTKFQNNIAAIKLLKELDSKDAQANPEEQIILSKYVGWGGIPQAFDSQNANWSKEYAQLKELLSDSEYSAARGSTLNAHYTNPTVIKAMYKALDNMGFKGGNILEPAMGTGNFFGAMPQQLAEKSELYGVELDEITGGIARQLYPKARVHVSGFEQTRFKDNYFDVAIGNVPFGNYGVADKDYDKHNFNIHDYFFAKALDKVAPGGVVAFVTSKGTLDKQNIKVREYLAQRAELVGAIRLPNNAFKSNANTEVTSDIVFLKKRPERVVGTPDWVFTSKNPDGISVNNYFIDNPQMILGTMKESGRMYNGNDTTCVPFENANLEEQLNKAITHLKASISVQKKEVKAAESKGIISATADVRNFTYTVRENKLYYRENDEMKEVSATGKKLERIVGMDKLRNAMRQLIDAEAENCTDDEMKQLQDNLNRVYDKFVKENGPVTSKANNVFSDDDDYNMLCALEDVNTQTNEVTKTPIFSKRTISPPVEITSTETIEEAFQVSLDQKGKIDMEYIAALNGISEENAIEQLKAANLIYLNPEKYDENKPFSGYEQTSEYLSGNVREKLRLAELMAESSPELFGRNVAALKEVIPQRIEASDIACRIGANWVEIKDYERFMREYAKASMIYTPLRRSVTGEYKIESKSHEIGVAATSSFGTSRMNSLQIFENLLNQRDVVVRDRIEEDGTVRYVLNKKETDLATEKARQMKEAFKKWLWDNPERREKYVTKYNELFNSIVGRKYDGSHQTFPGMSADIKLEPHQKDAVARAKYGGNTLLAHCVGAGKSFEMFATTMEKKRLGLIHKACVVVPKALTGQTATEWLKLYPNARLLVARDNDFTKNNRQKFFGKCVTGEYDGIVMSYEQFEKMPMSLEYRRNFLQKELDVIQNAIDTADRRERSTIKDLEREKKNITEKITKLLDAKTKDTSIDFEKLGIDYLVVDEAHNYKNGLVVSKMKNVSGVATRAAAKSEDILMKSQYLNEKSNYNGILFATGTPVSNSMTELYTMQRYLRPDLMKKAQLENFDDWASTFGEVVSQLEMKPAGDGFRTKKRFSKFTNLPELMQMYKEFADIKTADMLSLKVPELEGGKPQTIAVKPDEFQKAYMQILAQRSEVIHNGNVDPSVDNMLKITHEARLLGLDSRCLNPDETCENGKINACADNIMQIYNETAEKKGVQAVFCDVAVNTTDGRFSAYEGLKAALMERGIPENEICFASDAKNDGEREELMAQLRRSEKRIVIASTSKMGTGCNFQTHLAALHHLDIPWKPSDLEQRNGRIIRQGNEYDKVKVFNYVTEGTFDAYMMNIIVTKQKFIAQLTSSKAPARVCEDVDEMVLNYSEMQAIASGDPRIKEKIELDGEVARLRLLESEHQKERYHLQDTIRTTEPRIDIYKAKLDNNKIDIENAKKINLQGDNFSIQMNGKLFSERKDAGEELRKAVTKCMVTGEKKILGEIGDFKYGIERNTIGFTSGCYAFVQGKLTYSTELDLTSDIGNITRIENVLKNGIEKSKETISEDLQKNIDNIEQARATVDAPFPQADELAEKSARLEQLNNELNLDKVDEVVMNDENEDIDNSISSQTQEIEPPKKNVRR